MKWNESIKAKIKTKIPKYKKSSPYSIVLFFYWLESLVFFSSYFRPLDELCVCDLIFLHYIFQTYTFSHTSRYRHHHCCYHQKTNLGLFNIYLLTTGFFRYARTKYSMNDIKSSRSKIFKIFTKMFARSVHNSSICFRYVLFSNIVNSPFQFNLIFVQKWKTNKYSWFPILWTLSLYTQNWVPKNDLLAP